LFRSLLVDNWMRYLFSPLLGALGGLLAWSVYGLLSQHIQNDALLDIAQFASMGLCIAIACNLLGGVQDGQGIVRLMSGGLLTGLVGGLGGVLAGVFIFAFSSMLGAGMEEFLPRLVGCLLVGCMVGLSSRITSFDRFTVLAALGGLVGGAIAVLLWEAMDRFGGVTGLYSPNTVATYAPLILPMTLGFGIGAATYSLPRFVSGGTLTVLTGQFKGQSKNIETDDIVVGNNKRQLQWVLPKWEGIQDPHAKLIVSMVGKGHSHSIRNMCAKNVVVVRNKKKHRVKTKDTMELQDGDVLVFATGRNYVKVRYNQKTNE